MSILNYDCPAGPIGAALKLDTLATLASDKAALSELRDMLDVRLIVTISAKEIMDGADIGLVARALGHAPDGKSAMSVKEAPFMGNFSGKAQPDDGRPRTPAPIEQLHNDMMRNGPASYGVYHPRQVPPGHDIIMRFVDMRATYDALSPDLKAKIDGKTLPHFPRATADDPKPTGMPYALTIRQPRTNRAALLLPMSRTARVSDLPEEEGRALTGELWRIVEDSPFRHNVTLRSNDLVIWDNIATAHDNPAYPRAFDRVAWFCNTIREGEIVAHRLEAAAA